MWIPAAVTVMVRLTGLVLVLANAGTVVTLWIRVFHAMVYPVGTGLREVLFEGSLYGDPPFTGLAMLGIGLYLFFGGNWVVGRVTRGLSWGGGGTCRKCGYDVTGVEGRCPECGVKI